MQRTRRQGLTASKTPRQSAAKRRAIEDPQAKLPPGPGMPADDVAAHQAARIQLALVEIVAANGYKALKVRDLVEIAGVSTRAFYERFDSKEECFLRTYELIVRRATRRIIGAQAAERDWRRRPRLVLEEFARAIEKEPDQAYVALIEAYADGSVCLEEAWSAERAFEGMLVESLARPPAGVVVSSPVVEGIVAGVASVARSYLRRGQPDALGGAADEIMSWALSYLDKVASRLPHLDTQSVWRNTMLEPGNGSGRPATGDRVLVLTAVAKLAGASGYSQLTVPRIRAAAGVSRAKFDAHFDDVEDCYVEALEWRAGEAFTQAARAQTAANGWSGGVYRGIAALCEYVAADPFLISVCRGDDVPAGAGAIRSRGRLSATIAEQLGANVPRDSRPRPLAAMASTGAVWSLFHHHVIRDWSLRRQIAATLAYLALAPAIGARATIATIEAEQTA